MDAITTILQLAHMKHFTTPLSLFVDPSAVTNLENLLQGPEAFDVVNDLLIRTQALAASRGSSWMNVSVSDLLSLVSSARLKFTLRARQTREAYSVAWAAYSWFIAQGYKPLEDGGRKESHPRLTLMTKILGCTLMRDVKYWGMMIAYVFL
jgi:origin recognition complex subunit 3